MSTLQVANLHFESTGNNRIQYLGSTSGYVLVGGGSNVAVINSSSIYFPQNFQVDNLSINTVSANSNINAASYTTTGVVANVTGVYPASNSLGTALGSTSRRWIVNANTGNFSGAVTINNTLNTGNTTVNGSISVAGDSQLSGNVGIGVAPSSAGLLYIACSAINVDSTFTGSYASFSDSNTAITANRLRYSSVNIMENKNQNRTSAGSTTYNGSYLGQYSTARNGDEINGGDARATNIEATRSYAFQYANGINANTVDILVAVRASTYQYGSGEVNTSYGTFSQVSAGNSTVTGKINTAFGVYSRIESNTGMTIPTGYLYYGTHLGSTTTTPWGIYLTGESKNYFSGNVGIGDTSPTYKLSVNGTTNLGGAVSGITTLSAGNTSIVGSVNATSYTIGLNLVANTLGFYHSGTVNAASHTVGTAFTANATVVNAVSYYSGTLLVANNTVINATHIGGSPASSVVNTTAAFTRTGNTTFNANVILGSSAVAVGLQANGSYGAAGHLLSSNGTATYWANPSSLNVNNAVYATFLYSGSAGQIPFQSGVSTTSFVGPGTSGQILVSQGSTPFGPVFDDIGAVLASEISSASVGAYSLVYYYGGGVNGNDQVAGSSLYNAGIDGGATSISVDGTAAASVTRGSSALNGTWRIMGRSNVSGTSRVRLVLALRIV